MADVIVLWLIEGPATAAAAEDGLCALAEYLLRAHPSARLQLLASDASATLSASSASDAVRAQIQSVLSAPPPPPQGRTPPPPPQGRCDHLVCIAFSQASSPSSEAAVAAFVAARAPHPPTVHALAVPAALPPLARIAETTGGCAHVLAPAPAAFGPAAARAFGAAAFAPLGAVRLCVGHLTAAATLAPDPLLRLRRLRSALPTFPAALGVVGFAPARLLPSPPALSAHVVVPAARPCALCAVLARALHAEHMCAVVALGPEWCGLLTVPALSSSSTAAGGPLVLHVLRPGQQMAFPGVGALHRLVSFSSVALAGRTPVELANAVQMAGTQLVQLQSLMLAPAVLPTQASVSAALDRLRRLACQMPATQHDLLVQYDTMINASRAYRCPAIALLAANTIVSITTEAEAHAHPSAPALREVNAHAMAIIQKYLTPPPPPQLIVPTAAVNP